MTSTTPEHLEHELAVWLEEQQLAYVNGTLEPHKITALNAMTERTGVDWFPDRPF